MKDREYRCPVCGERFRKGNKLEKHVKNEHGFDIAAKTCEVRQKQQEGQERDGGTSW